MAIASITQWLADPNRQFLYGRSLYEQYGDNPVTLAVIRSGSGAHHFQKLIEGLKKVNQKINLEPKQITIPDRPAEARHNSKSNPDFTSAPDEILNIRNDKNNKYARARKLFEMIRHMDSRQHRLEAALELLELMDEVNEKWAVIDEWRETGKVREQQLAETEKAVEELTVAELMKEARNLPTYITKDRSRLKDEKSDSKRIKYTTRLEIHIKRLELVKKRLEAI